MKKHDKVSTTYTGSFRPVRANARDEGIMEPRMGTSSVHPVSSPSAGKEPVDTNKYKGYKNYKTWELAVTIQNNEGLYNMCRDLYLDGYVSFSSMRGKLMEFGPRWKADHLTSIYWNDDDLCAKEITRVLIDLFAKPKPKTNK